MVLEKIRRFPHIPIEYTLLFAILAVALLLRVSGIGWGLPYLYHPDENVVVTHYLTMVKLRTLNPHWFGYSGLILYLNGFIYGLYFLLQLALGNFHNGKDVAFPVMQTLGSGYTADSNIFYMARAVSILFGLGTVYITYRCAKVITSNSWVGLLAAAFCAVSNANVVQSRLVLPNIYIAFFTTLTILYSIKAYKTGRTRDYLLAGAAIGLTIASKYNGGIVAFALLAAHFIRTGLNGWKNKNIYLAAALAALIFLGLNIYTVLDYPEFLRDLRILKDAYSGGLIGTGDSPLAYYVSYLWRNEPIAAAAAFCGIGYALWKRSWLAVITGIFPLIYFPFICLFKNANERALLPMLPALYVMAAWFMGIVSQKVSARFPSKINMVRVGTAAFLFLTFAFPLRQTLSNCIQVFQTDSRSTARIWIDHHIAQGSSIALEAYAPYVDPKNYQVQIIALGEPPNAQWFRDNHIQYVVFSDWGFKRFYLYPNKYAETIARYEQLFRSLEPVKIFNDGGYEVRIYRVTSP